MIQVIGHLEALDVASIARTPRTLTCTSAVGTGYFCPSNRWAYGSASAPTDSGIG